MKEQPSCTTYNDDICLEQNVEDHCFEAGPNSSTVAKSEHLSKNYSFTFKMAQNLNQDFKDSCINRKPECTVAEHSDCLHKSDNASQKRNTDCGSSTEKTSNVDKLVENWIKTGSGISAETQSEQSTKNSILETGLNIIRSVDPTFLENVMVKHKVSAETDPSCSAGDIISEPKIKVVHNVDKGNVYMVLHTEQSSDSYLSGEIVPGKRSRGRPKKANVTPHKCDVCKKTFARGTTLRLHMKIHTGEKPHRCTYCDRSFTQATSLKMHVLLHTGEKPYECSECNKNFRHRETLRVHQMIHTGERPHPCTLCEKSFTQSNQLTRHMYSHTGEKPYKCTMCEKSFSQAGTLKQHLSMHTGERKHRCEICARNYRSAESLRCHRMTHTGEKPYKCTMCGLECRQQTTLTRHVRRHHVGNFECTECHRNFTQECELNTHLADCEGKCG